MIEKWTTPIPKLSGREGRTVYVYVPDEAQENPEARYPVLYMFDGHNVFFDSDATYGKCWGMKEYLESTNTPLIVVAVDCNHSPNNGRLSEYSPFTFEDPKLGYIRGRGRTTMDWFAHTLKGMIDEKYPTLPGRETTWIAGSSMGGLMSLYGVTAHNETFSRAACLSPSVRFSFTEVKADIKKAKLAPGTRVYISWGEREGNGRHALAQYTGKALEVTNLLTARGATVYPYCQLDGRHCEADWRRQLGRCFTFLFGWR